MKKLTCKRCSHVWYPRLEEIPKTCPKCKSPYWDSERRTTYKLLSWAERKSLEKALDSVMMRPEYQDFDIPDRAIIDALKLAMLRKGVLFDIFKQNEALKYLRSV